MPALLACLAFALLLALGACGSLEEDADPTAFGDGSGGSAVPQGTVVTATLVNTLSVGLGQVSYDNGYFTTAQIPLVPTASSLTMGVLRNPADQIRISMSLIAGRADTPCRFTAALAARDDGFTLEGDGADRLNATGLEFHEVRLNDGTTYVLLACATLTSAQGVQVTVTAPTSAGRGTLQVHHVLNSIRVL